MLHITKFTQIKVISILAISLPLGLSQVSNSKTKPLGISLRTGLYYANNNYISSKDSGLLRNQ
jgi:hypothetical protein